MRTTSKNEEGRHPIRVAAERTGLSTDVLRAWEKRYAVVEPRRSETGRRFYTDEDVERLLLLRRATEAGRPIGHVAPLATEELRDLVAEDEAARLERDRVLARPVEPDAAAVVEAAFGAVREMDTATLEGVLMQGAMRLGAAVFLERVAAALLQQIGDAWHNGELSAAHEHMATAVVRRVLGWLLWSGSAGPSQGVLVVATPTGQVHEMGGLLCAAAAVSEGWRVMYLGADLPAVEIARAARETGAEAVALSLVYPLGDATVGQEIRRLRAELSDGVALVVGGGGADSYASVLRAVGAIRPTDLAEFRAVLSDLVADRALNGSA